MKTKRMSLLDAHQCLSVPDCPLPLSFTLSLSTLIPRSSLLPLFYFTVSLLASWDRKLGDFLGRPPSPSPLVISSSMVISTLSPAISHRPFSFSLSFSFCGLGCFLWAFSRGSSSLLPESYFLSLRDSCFFFSEAEAFSLDWSMAA